MEPDAVSVLLSQARILLISILGVVALAPAPDRHGAPRIRGPLGQVVTYVGIFFLSAPWFAIPFMEQPRLAGQAAFLARTTSLVLGLAGLTLYALSLRALLPAFRGQFSEFTPGRLVTSGPYAHVRHPIYLAALSILLSVDLALGATVSVLFLPLCYGALAFVMLYEERWILGVRFPAEYARYRSEVRHRILPAWASLCTGLLYLALAVPCLMNVLEVVCFEWIV